MKLTNIHNQPCQLSLDDCEPVKSVELTEPAEPAKAFNPAEKICHGQPMRKVNLSPKKVAWRCDECQTLMETRN
jgi:hypothetical protein